MNELALFAGAGGGLLASKLLGWRTICAVEKDPFARSILIARQNDRILETFPIWDDVRTFNGLHWRGHIDVVSGGFPCQSFSTASRGKRVAENLWPQMLTIIRAVQPRFVFCENVSKASIEQAANDLYTLGYETKAVALGAKDLGGDHIRKRYWLLAYADDKSELLRGIDAEMAKCSKFRHSVWTASPRHSRMVDGLAPRVERYKATGNGQVPIVAVTALKILVHI